MHYEIILYTETRSIGIYIDIYLYKMAASRSRALRLTNDSEQKAQRKSTRKSGRKAVQKNGEKTADGIKERVEGGVDERIEVNIGERTKPGEDQRESVEASKWSGSKQKQRAEGYMQNNGWMEGSEAIVERSPGSQKGVGDPEEGVMQ